MENELLFINITETIGLTFGLIGPNVLFIYSGVRQKLPIGYILFAFSVIRGFDIKEWVAFVLMIINCFAFMTLSGNAHNSFLHKYGIKPETWIFGLFN